jgi:hypothetical protein
VVTFQLDAETGQLELRGHLAVGMGINPIVPFEKQLLSMIGNLV